MFDTIFSKDKIIKLDNVNSTNEFAYNYLKNHTLNEGTIIWAIYQTKGKGQKGNTWDSEAGKNLTFSIILHPLMIEPSRQFFLNKAVSLGMIDFLKTKTDETNVKIKWPNDIYIGKNKIAGILIENEILGNTLQSVIIGIGLNINQTTFSPKVPNPTSLQLITGQELNTEDVLLQLLSNLETRIVKLYNNDIELINDDYLKNLLYFNMYKKYLWQNTAIEAKIITVSEYGQLILKTTANKIIKCDFKEIVFLHD